MTLPGGFELDTVTTFGLVALSLTLVFDAYERRNAWFTFAFGISCIGASAYGFLSGAWPFGIVEGIWAVLKFIQWNNHRKKPPAHGEFEQE